MDALARLTHERELLRHLLQVAQPRAGARAALQRALETLARVTSATRVYLELYAEGSERPRWSVAVGCNDADAADIRALTSRGIVAAALAKNEIVHTPSAMLDERFRERESVQERSLQSVLCVPLGEDASGVLYLEGPPVPFSAEDVELAREVGVALAPLVAAIAARSHAESTQDATRELRQRLSLGSVVGKSAAMAKVFQRVALAAPSSVHVLITGAPGTGKTQIARAIHDNGPRRAGPFVSINSGALPENLIESELFGSVPGAFTGAVKMQGKVAAADGGTLFFDEIGELPFSSQQKLLQVLDSKKYSPLGSSQVLTANVRVIAATNQDLEALVEEKRFRDDLYYRLKVVTIRMPNLAERREDIPLLVDELLSRLAEEQGGPALKASEGLHGCCAALDYPGNIRDLRNRLAVALLAAQQEGAAQVEPRHLDQEGAEASGSDVARTFHAATRAFQREFLTRRLLENDWRITEVAREIDLTRAHVYNLIRELKISKPDAHARGK